MTTNIPRVERNGLLCAGGVIHTGADGGIVGFDWEGSHWLPVSLSIRDLKYFLGIRSLAFVFRRLPGLTLWYVGEDRSRLLCYYARAGLPWVVCFTRWKLFDLKFWLLRRLFWFIRAARLGEYDDYVDISGRWWRAVCWFWQRKKVSD